jgi:hypothetical protein
MRRILYLAILCCICTLVQAQHVFENTSLSEALIELDKSSEKYSISFVYDELEDFTVSKTIRQGCKLPDAVREVCGFYPIHVSIKDKEIFVECIQKDKKKLMGRLLGPDGKPVAYANILLLTPSDSVMVNGGVSNEAGHFVIPCSAAQAMVRISCVGFKTIERVIPIGNVGTIRMEMETNYLGNVVISGRMPVIRSESDRLVYVVGNDEYAKGHNVLELLSRVPMVCMDGRTAMILGRGPAKFMLNGRISEMGNEVIQQKLWTMHSEDVERIEVISIPSGRYQTVMGSGYINIVLRRDQTLGWRGDVTTQAGVSDDWSACASGSINYASTFFDMTADVTGGRRTQATGNLMTYRFENAGDVLSDTYTKLTEKEIAANLTLRFKPFKSLELGGMLSWQVLWPEKHIDGTITTPESLFKSEAGLTPDDNTSTRSITAYCDYRLDTKGKLLSLSCHDFKKDDDAMSYVRTDNRRIAETVCDFRCPFDYHIQSVKADLTLPFHFATFDAGASYTNIKNYAFTSNNMSGANISMQTRVGDADYKEKTKAAYLSIHRDWSRFTFKAGLRYEYIDWIQTIYLSGGKSYTYNIPHDYWLPSLSLSYKPKEGQQINLSWGASCQHPNFYDLNPIYTYKTVVEFTKGEPYLEPSRTSSLELSYHNIKGLYACAYYHHASNVIEPLTSTTIDRGDKVFQACTLYYQMGQYNQTGIYLNYQRPLTCHLQATVEGDIYYHDFDKKDEIFYSIYSRLHGWGKRLAVSADWYLNSRHTLLLNARYQHWFSSYAGLTKTDSYGYFNFALRYSMLNDRLKLSLVANDPFRQFITDETKLGCCSIEGFEWARKKLDCFSHTNHHAHYIGLTATYSFGGKNVRRLQQDKRDPETQRAIRKR